MNDNYRTFKLGPGDAAIIFRADGSEEVRTVGVDDDGMVSANAYKCAQAVTALHDEEARRFIDARIEDKLRILKGDLSKN